MRGIWSCQNSEWELLLTVIHTLPIILKSHVGIYSIRHPNYNSLLFHLSFAISYPSILKLFELLYESKLSFWLLNTIKKSIDYLTRIEIAILLTEMHLTTVDELECKINFVIKQLCFYFSFLDIQFFNWWNTFFNILGYTIRFCS